jgi:hypothetical protein
MPPAGAAGTEVVEAIEAPAANAAPDWSALTETIRCPLCRYDLRGLIDPRCPECGYAFDWSHLLDPAQREHSYLFEHHPESNFRSFARTLFGHLRPRAFWQSIRPEQAVKVRRLVRYWMLVGIVLSCGVVCYGLMIAISRAHLFAEWRASAIAMYTRPSEPVFRNFAAQMIKRYGSIQAYIDDADPGPFSAKCLRAIGEELRDDLTSSTAALILAIALGYLAWPWITVGLTMATFRISMRRARISPAHLARVAVYCCDVGAWFVLILVGLMIAETWRGLRHGGYPSRLLRDDQLALLTVLAALLLVAVYRQAIAFRIYLKVDHAMATALAVQLILLTALVVGVISIGPLQSWVLRGVYHL